MNARHTSLLSRRACALVACVMLTIGCGGTGQAGRGHHAALAVAARGGGFVPLSLVMTSAGTGWAVLAEGSPGFAVARTTDGARTWTVVTPPLPPGGHAPVLFAPDGADAWLALVTAGWATRRRVPYR